MEHDCTSLNAVVMSLSFPTETQVDEAEKRHEE